MFLIQHVFFFIRLSRWNDREKKSHIGVYNTTTTEQQQQPKQNVRFRIGIEILGTSNTSAGALLHDIHNIKM